MSKEAIHEEFRRRQVSHSARTTHTSPAVDVETDVSLDLDGFMARADRLGDISGELEVLRDRARKTTDRSKLVKLRNKIRTLEDERKTLEDEQESDDEAPTNDERRERDDARAQAAERAETQRYFDRRFAKLRRQVAGNARPATVCGLPASMFLRDPGASTLARMSPYRTDEETLRVKRQQEREAQPQRGIPDTLMRPELVRVAKRNRTLSPELAALPRAALVRAGLAPNPSDSPLSLLVAGAEHLGKMVR